MPDDLFYPVGVVTCVMIFESNKPNAGKKTWFGYLKNDGFIKRKHKGRIDQNANWKEIKKRFLQAYKDNDEVLGLSVKRAVEHGDEWCAEAYMETDYSNLTSTDFEATMKKFLLFKTIGLPDMQNKVEDDENKVEDDEEN